MTTLATDRALARGRSLRIAADNREAAAILRAASQPDPDELRALCLAVVLAWRAFEQACAALFAVAGDWDWEVSA